MQFEFNETNFNHQYQHLNINIITKYILPMHADESAWQIAQLFNARIVLTKHYCMGGGGLQPLAPLSPTPI